MYDPPRCACPGRNWNQHADACPDLAGREASPDLLQHLRVAHGWSDTWLNGALRCEDAGDVGLIERNHVEAHRSLDAGNRPFGTQPHGHAESPPARETTATANTDTRHAAHRFDVTRR